MFTDFKSDKDMPNERIYELDNGNKFSLTRTDPYGFVYIHMHKGQVPDELKSAYTTYDAAKAAMESYLRNKPKPVVITKEP
jgi:hypothetical protein